MKETSAGAIIFRVQGDDRLYLLLHYGKGHWDFPKGHVEEGETLKQTVRREVAEETGITDIHFVPGFEESIHYFFKRKGETISKTVYFFLVETKEKNIKLSFEHKGYKWLRYEDAIKQLTFQSAKNLLKKAEELLRQRSFFGY